MLGASAVWAVILLVAGGVGAGASSPAASGGILNSAAVADAAAAAPVAEKPAGNSGDAAKPCSAQEYRQLDFWVGEWRVFEASDNSPVGSSKIEIVMDSCGIKESFDAPSGGNAGADYIGTSFSSYDRKDGKWHQMYIDNTGSVGLYTGGLDGADMAMTCPAKGGATQKMIYRRQADGSVRQIGTLSTDGGKTWQAGYDYVYRRK
jgi:hypothetical protein